MDGVDGKLDDDVLMEDEPELTQLLSGADEPTFALATEEDIRYASGCRSG